MTHPLTPREKVENALYSMDDWRLASPEYLIDNILTALASGSGDHAELARLAEEATARFAGHNLNADGFGLQIWGDSLKGGPTHVLDVRGWGYLTGGGHGALGLTEDEGISAQRAIQAYAVAAWNAVPALLAENAALRAERVHLVEQKEGAEDAMFNALSRATEAERKLAEAEDENRRWALRFADVREASGLGVKPMLSEVPDELRKMRSLIERAADLMRQCTDPDRFEGASTLNVYANMRAWLSDLSKEAA